MTEDISGVWNVRLGERLCTYHLLTYRNSVRGFLCKFGHHFAPTKTGMITTTLAAEQRFGRIPRIPFHLADHALNLLHLVDEHVMDEGEILFGPF